MNLHDVPVARSMLAMVRQLSTGTHPVQRFLCYWIAFNNIYVTIAEQQGERPEPRLDSDGSRRMRRVARVNIPEVNPVPERRLIRGAIGKLTREVKCRLIEHPSTRFFVYRTPTWKGRPITRDIQGQRLNGVLNVGYTLDQENPVWSPIDVTMFEQYLSGRRDVQCVDSLVRQITDMLYTVRNNSFHGGKRSDDANDGEILENALPLLEMIVEFFVSVPAAA